MTNDEDDSLAAAAWAAANLKAAIDAIPQELIDREDQIEKKQQLQNASAVSKTRELQKLAERCCLMPTPAV